MARDLTAGAARELLRASAGILKSWAAAFLLFLLPFDILFRVDTFRTMDFSRIDWLFVLCFVVLLLALLAALFTLPFLAALLLPCAFGWTGAVARIRRVNFLLVAFFASFCLMIFGKSWLDKVLGIRFAPAPWFKILLLAAALGAVLALLSRISAALDALFSKRLHYTLVPLVAASLVVVASKELARGPRPGTAPRAAAAAGGAPNVILITFDALRAADMPVYGYRLDTSPHLTRFSRESYVIERAVSNSNWTRPSVASLLTGTYPSRHRLVNKSPGNNFLPAEMKGRTLAGELRRRGYRTLAVVSNVDQAHPLINDTYGDFDAAPLDTISPDYAARRDRSVLLISALVRRLPYLDGALCNWVREMAVTYFVFLDRNVALPGQEMRRATVSYPPEVTFRMARDLIRNGSSPFFLWVHVFPPHWPYLSSPRHRQAFLKGEIGDRVGALNRANVRFYDPGEQPVIDRYRLRYDENILYADEAFGEFADFLKASGRYDDSLIIVSADHGESFERGYWLHRGPSLHDPLIRIPMLIRLPGQAEGKRIRANAEQADVLPTVLDLLGYDVPKWADGESLKNALTRNEPGAKPKFSMQLEGARFSGVPRTGTVAVIRGDYKYILRIRPERGELYDLSRDPGEMRDLSLSEPRIAAGMKRLITERLAADARP